MKRLFLIIISLTLWVAFPAHAGQDPIGWSLFPATGFPAQTQTGSTYSVTYTLTNNLPFTVPLAIKRSYSGNTFAVNDKCHSTNLAPNGSCTISISIQPARAGSHSSIVTMVYGYNQVKLPTLTTTAVSTKTSDNVDGYVTTPLPPDTQVGTAYPVTFLFRNDSESSITASSVTVTGFAPSSNTCTSAVAANDTCKVSGSFTPAATGQATLSVSYNYNSGAKSVPLSTTTNVSSGGGGCTQVLGQATLPLPTSTFIYGDNVVKYTFTNLCSTSVTLGNVSLNALLDDKSVNSYLTKGTTSNANDTCSGATLTANQNCTLYVAVLPTATGNALSVEANIPYGTGNTAAAASSEQVSSIPNQTTLHNHTFVNQCDFPVWIEFANGNGQPANTGVFSPDPTPSPQSPSQYKLPGEHGGVPTSTTLSFTAYENGKIYGRTGCVIDPSSKELICKTATCQTNPNSGACLVSKGGAFPSTAAEQFISPTLASDGVYDVSIINGFNLPVEYKGLGPVSSTNAFSCAAAGALIQPSTKFNPPLASCPWLFTPPNTGADQTANYVFVAAGSDNACTSNCSTTSLCGMAYNNVIDTGAGVPVNRTCGAFQGYWTVANFIGFSASAQWGTVNLYNNYTIGSALPAGYGNSTAHAGLAATYYDLYGCVPTTNNSLNSGYNSNVGPLVCGCYNWDQSGSPALTNSAFNCLQSNSFWIDTVFPRIDWLKTACPTAYSYQFDDPSSQFTCNETGKFTSYEIVFCPGGKTGNPGGS